MSILVNTLLDRVQKEFLQPDIIWENININTNDLEFLKDECNKESEFDPKNKRKQMYEDMINGNLFVVATKCDYGQIIGLFKTIEEISELPWDLWGRILRLFSESTRNPFKIFFLANRSLREFPLTNEPITPENINGGYTYRCNPETIIIYRAEDATRVLIHELQHSCCLDNPKNGIDIIEAETEAWAELFYIAILSQGKKYMFKDMLQRQSEWMIKQNKKVKKHMKNPTIPVFFIKSKYNNDLMEFPWRYTIGKEQIWEKWGILRYDELKPIIHVGNSLRLTYPPTNILKERFKVSKNSIIL
jgi:hypothetical protein